jgi:hypothetical protein
MVRRPLVRLAAFLVRPQPGPFPLSVIVLDRHCNHGASRANGSTLAATVALSRTPIKSGK